MPERRPRRAWLTGVLLVALGVGPSLAGDTVRPNIVLITVDTFRPDHLGYYGHHRDTSPNLDSLSAEGVFFRQAFTSSGWTAPGLISILTSLYAPRHGVDIRGRSIDAEVTTLPEALRAAGYRAPDVFFLTDIPNFRHLGLEAYPRRNRYLRDGDEILFRWLEEEAAASQQPFFLYYHYRDLHQPYAPGPPYEDDYLRQAFGHPYNPWTWVQRFVSREKVDLVRTEVMMPRGIIDFASWDKGWVDALYDGEIRRMDERLFGRLRRALRDGDLLDNTVVVVSADHGEELLEHGLIGHVSTFKEGRLVDEIARIPLIFWAPGRLPAGVVVEDVVQCIDVMPTLLELAGTAVPAAAQGRSLLPLMRGDELASRPVYLETSGGGYTASLEQYGRRTRAVRGDRWKLIWRTPEDELQLYDVVADPAEEDDVAAHHPQVADSLRQLLVTWVAANPRLGSPDAEEAPAQRPGATESPTVLFPGDGDTLEYIGAGQTIQLRFGGPEYGRYSIEYEIGRGAYHLEGLLDVDSSTPSYGPFHADFWNSLVLYNPWRFRVFPKGNPEASSDWVTFELAAAGDGGVPLTMQLSGAVFAAGAVAGQIGDLVVGLLWSLADLGVWLASLDAADLTAWALLIAIAGALVWPRLQRFGEARLRAWGMALAYVAIVYATVPVFPTIWSHVREHTGEVAIAHLGTIAVISLAAAISVRVWRQPRTATTLLRRLALLVVLVLYGLLLVRFGQFPAERLHLLEYGFMAWLLHRALVLHTRPGVAYPLALALTAVIGFGDETIQWILPQRFFELKDVGLNIVSAGLGLACTALAGGSDRRETA